MQEKALTKAVVALLHRITNYVYTTLTRCDGDPFHCWHTCKDKKFSYKEGRGYCKKVKVTYTYYECCRCHVIREKTKTTKQ